MKDEKALPCHLTGMAILGRHIWMTERDGDARQLDRSIRKCACCGMSVIDYYNETSE